MSKLKAGRTFEYKLQSERCDPESDVFLIKVLSGEADEKVSDLCKQFVAEAVIENKKAIVGELIEITIEAWPWEGSLRSVLTDRECWELIGAAREGAALTVDERKKFVLPSKSETDSSASDAKASA